jgi:hypothetical protein
MGLVYARRMVCPPRHAHVPARTGRRLVRSPPAHRERFSRRLPGRRSAGQCHPAQPGCASWDPDLAAEAHRRVFQPGVSGWLPEAGRRASPRIVGGGFRTRGHWRRSEFARVTVVRLGPCWRTWSHTRSGILGAPMAGGRVARRCRRDNGRPYPACRTPKANWFTAPAEGVRSRRSLGVRIAVMRCNTAVRRTASGTRCIGAGRDLKTNDQRFRWSEAVLVGVPGLEPGTSSSRISRAQRCADRRSPRSLTSVRAKVLRSWRVVPIGITSGRHQRMLTTSIPRQSWVLRPLHAPGSTGSIGGPCPLPIRFRA